MVNDSSAVKEHTNHLRLCAEYIQHKGNDARPLVLFCGRTRMMHKICSFSKLFVCVVFWGNFDYTVGILSSLVQKFKENLSRISCYLSIEEIIK